MNRTIFKYKIHLIDTQSVTMPEGSEPLSVQLQDGDIQMWALVNKDAPEEKVTVEIYGTGSAFPSPIEMYRRKFLGTVQKDGFVWHIFSVE